MKDPKERIDELRETLNRYNYEYYVLDLPSARTHDVRKRTS